ncbi:MAG: hypothetical protein JO112_09670 [Planctomycetes bacterium]|nr:hypothetical protein [Planctomycetota bacterium]
MSWKVYPLFLILLLVSAFTDDVWAKTTPQHADDVLATVNNDYLSLSSQHPQSRIAGEKVGPPCANVSFLPPKTVIAAPRGCTESTFSVPFHPDSLYFFMSLQC